MYEEQLSFIDTPDLHRHCGRAARSAVFRVMGTGLSLFIAAAVLGVLVRVPATTEPIELLRLSGAHAVPIATWQLFLTFGILVFGLMSIAALLFACSVVLRDVPQPAKTEGEQP